MGLGILNGGCRKLEIRDWEELPNMGVVGNVGRGKDLRGEKN